MPDCRKALGNVNLIALGDIAEMKSENIRIAFTVYQPPSLDG
jgi:hypothetical protein